MELINHFGLAFSATLIAIALVYFTIAFAPIWLPACRAFRRSSRLPRPFLFVGTVASLVYGIFTFLFVAFLIPLQVYGIHIAPSLEAAGIDSGRGVLHVLRFLVDYWWVYVTLTQLTLTWYITSRLGKRWAYICAGPVT